jgi:hypothetical protein
MILVFLILVKLVMTRRVFEQLATKHEEFEPRLLICGLKLLCALQRMRLKEDYRNKEQTGFLKLSAFLFAVSCEDTEIRKFYELSTSTPRSC